MRCCCVCCCCCCGVRFCCPDRLSLRREATLSLLRFYTTHHALNVCCAPDAADGRFIAHGVRPRHTVVFTRFVAGSCLVLRCPTSRFPFVVSCPVPSCPVISRVSCPIVPCRILSRPVLPDAFPSNPIQPRIIPYRIMSFPVLSSCVVFCSTLSRAIPLCRFSGPVRSCPALSCPVLVCPLPSWLVLSRPVISCPIPS